jgi:hypothetical protein
MQNEFQNDFAPPRDGGAKQLYLYASLGMAAVIFFLALFLHTPIGTEARTYVFYSGYLAQGGGPLDLLFPAGSNQRVVSMVAFALSRDACGFGGICLNVIQIAQLLLCVVIGTVHLHQLLRRPLLVAGCMALWCLSLPVFAAGFWQATQHDKLAFLFSLSALSFGFSALRTRPKGKGFVMATVFLLALFVLALNSKEIAFFLPVAAIAQIALLGQAGSISQRVRRAAVYILPLVYAVFYIGVYSLRLKSAWQAHVMGGSLLANAQYYWLSLMGRQNSSAVSSILALLVLLAALGYAVFCMRGRMHDVAGRTLSGGMRVLTYFAVILGVNMVLVAGAAYPEDFYLLVAQWAFLGFLATALVLVWSAGAVSRLVALAALTVLLVIFVHKRIGDMAGGSDGDLLREAHVLNADYARLRPYCGAQMAQGMQFVFPEHPLGFFYFFRGGSDGPEQLLAPFLCEGGPAAPMAYSYDGNATQSHPGEIMVVFNQDLSIRNISKK